MTESRLSAVLHHWYQSLMGCKYWWQPGFVDILSDHCSRRNLLIELFLTGITKHRQISDCEEILQQLHDILQKINPTTKAVPASTAAVKKRSTLQKVKESINNAGKIVAWPLNKDETKGLLDRLQTHKTTFILTVSADSTFVSHPRCFVAVD